MSDLGLQRGSVALRSSGPITFSPDGVLFVADNAAATIHAIDVGDTGQASGAEPFDLEHVDERVASYLGAAVSDVAIRDLAVHPVTHNVYLSVQRGHGDDARRGARTHRPPRRIVDATSISPMYRPRRSSSTTHPTRQTTAATSRFPPMAVAKSSRSATAPSAS